MAPRADLLKNIRVTRYHYQGLYYQGLYYHVNLLMIKSSYKTIQKSFLPKCQRVLRISEGL